MHKERTKPCPRCGDGVDIRRVAAGYPVCMECGDEMAASVRWCVVPLNKSNYTVITDPSELRGLNPKQVN